MVDYYNLDIIPIILNRFKANNIVISGLSDEELIHQVLDYCNDKEEASYIAIDSNDNPDENVIVDFTLNVLPTLSDFDAIFLNDDPNWYTVFNELKIIQQNNNDFPLVFICNNIFPHKRRDSYINPEIIPSEFLNDYSDMFIHGEIKLKDGFFHAIDENTSQNGVLTAIEDFINEYPSIGIMDIKFLKGIVILYPKNTISKIRIGRILEEIAGFELDYGNLSDNIVENQILTNNILNLDITDVDTLKIEIDKKDRIINNFENQIKVHHDELDLMNSQINNFDSKLDLKNSQIKNIESKLINRDVEINNLNNKVNDLNNEINSLKSQISQSEKREFELNNQLQSNINLLNDKNNQIRINIKEIHEKDQKLDSFKRQSINQLSNLDNKKYCISCYKEEIDNNHVEIEYLKNDSLTKKLLIPLAYVYLIVKSKPKDLSLNFKLYKAIKNSKCFDIGFYLNNNKDIRDSKWCKYFSPELHYVCNGFNENRTFNKKYFNRNSKKELLDYILNCKY